jgi:hypothetical protein
MTLQIRKAEGCEREELRTLLIDAADQLAGQNSCLLEARLPWDGYPILLADDQARPVVVSFDLQNSLAALLNGLQATDQLANALPWVNQVYAALQNRRKTPRLVVVTRETPPGSVAVLADSPQLALFTCRVLLVNGDRGLLLERADQGAPSAASAPPLVPARQEPAPPVRQAAAKPADETLPPLSRAERAYFKQL